MFLATLAPEEAVGHIVRHNIADPQGRKAFSKGQRLKPGDLAHLRELGVEQVRVAVLEAGDIHEDEAADRLAAAVCGAHISANPASHSRANLLAATNGIVQVNPEALLQINSLEGLTVATLPSHTVVHTRRRVATIKIIPFAVREELLAEAEQLAQASAPVITLKAFQQLKVGVVLSGSAAVRPRIERGIYPAIEGRITELGSAVLAVRYIETDEQAVAAAIEELLELGAELLIMAGETSIMDRDDVTPMGIRLAGGQIEHYGAPVEPGNLLLLAYYGEVPILGAPGCVRSRDANIVDLLLPRLMAGEHITKRDIIALGHGGLLS